MTRQEMWRQFDEECEVIARECAEEGYPSHGENYELRVEALKEYYPELFEEPEEEPEEETIAARMRNSEVWDAEDCARLCELAGYAREWEAADGETFEQVVYEAADVLGVEVV